VPTQINVYLAFNGNCREVMNFYKDCLGGNLELQTVGESPMASQMHAGLKDHVLHSTLTNGPLVIMASDMHSSELFEGNTVLMCIQCSSKEEVKTYFSNLSEGGKITDPLAEMFWGGYYGALKDKYGKHWIFNCDKNQI
jgi:PhnB protein